MAILMRERSTPPKVQEYPIQEVLKNENVTKEERSVGDMVTLAEKVQLVDYRIGSKTI